jgi:serine/threonine protein kinase
VLLDSECHCQITDFGSTRHCEATVTQSTTALAYNYAAPELFGMCTTCYQSDCDETHDRHHERHKTKTMKTDVYAFGCLYYAVRPKVDK